MAITNSQIAAMFYEMADLLDLEGRENYYRARAYRNAARVIENLPTRLADMVAENKDLTVFPGIGAAIAAKIKKIVISGEFVQLQDQEKRWPQLLSVLRTVRGLGPKRIKQIYTAFPIRNIEDLKKLIDARKLLELPGFGQKMLQTIEQGLQEIKVKPNRILLFHAEKIVERMKRYLNKTPHLEFIEFTGSYRRKKDTVGDLDILMITSRQKAAVDYFVQYPEVLKILSQGSTRASVILFSGLRVDLRVVPKISFGAALQHFTGSVDHNILLRALALKQNLKLNEYGLFSETKRIAGKTEAEIYNQLGLSYIEPELRENTGEIEAGQEHSLPTLIELSDLKGDLHAHTHYTDGKYSIEEMANAAIALGYEYLAITDHSKRLAMTNGLDEKRLFEQIKIIDQLNKKFQNFQILKAIEVDILEDGTLDLSNDVLKELDLTVCSIHSKFNLPEIQQTERVIRAMDNPYFNILGHPTGRLINHRQPYQINLEKIMQVAKERGCIFEINAQPYRLDLNEIYIRRAKDLGLKFAISSDAHTINHLQFMRYGVYQARRGWITAADVINTRNLNALRILLKR
jgi:DNA polymerase (family 10)